jgi:hypothetical protein
MTLAHVKLSFVALAWLSHPSRLCVGAGSRRVRVGIAQPEEGDGNVQIASFYDF